ncbi:hypothetical protein SCLCIDRAFT_11869 [Scleroderma citrinum Foug A]|uniref:Uncharacterized protein n=1 Tax=Scleroderma citrinum Foug A TaxID=1036808 RepID=A0A0C3D8L7_9AGAM|nr:hypothetical protein SCLCIDRAFT_11869 [Scleroderma citrinum Foug A]
MSSTEDPYCRGGKPGEDSCDCEMFSSSDNPKRCMECGHGESKHGPSRARNPPSSVPAPTSKNLSDIFSDISGTVPCSTPLPTGALSRPTPLLNGIVSRTAAHNEALYTKATGSSRMSQPTKASKRAPTSTDRKASNASPPGRPFQVQSIALLTCGLTGRGKMFDEMLPTNPTQKTQFRLRLENHGCLIQNPDGYSINASWTYDQVTDALRAWFPKPFQHIESRQKSKAKSEYPDWQVVNCSGCRFTVIVEANFPTGETLRSFKGRAKAGTNESHLWLVTRNRIPEDVFESWSTQIHVVGMDIESEGSGDENSDDGDMTNDDEVIDLSSSMIDLGIDGSAKRPIQVLSPESCPIKKFKDDHSNGIPVLPLPPCKIDILKVTPPLPLEIIEVNDSDHYLRGVIPHNDKNAPHMTSAWDMSFVFTPKLGKLIFWVEDTLYKVVHDTLKKDSEIFCGMFDLDLGGPLPKMEGTIDEDPIKLYSTTVEQFDLYLEASGG